MKSLGKSLLLSLYLFCSFYSMGQISVLGIPTSFESPLFRDVPTYILPIVNEDQLLAEDVLTQLNKSAPLRFGKDFQVQLNLHNAGIWETLPNGDRVWRLKIRSKNAKSINFIFDDFFMPVGATFYIYNQNKTDLIGAFTHRNNKEHGQFSTAPVQGDVVILEYYEPISVQNQGRLQVSSIIHAYRDMFKTANDYIQSLDKDFGDAGNCNVDINCNDGNDWQDEKRSVAMILTNGNTRWCSGVMINNTAQDTTPYLLTGNHCLDGNEDTWLFIFNYESPTCNGFDGNLSQSISGSTTRASYAISDFALLELSAAPPANYLVYYAGWNNSTMANAGSVCIHHPSGDVKKISKDNDILMNGFAYNSHHWRVQDWEIGTTEAGSSGAPLFNSDGKVIGQLHGGNASCSSGGFDEFGKLSSSWLGGGTFNAQLKHWLDPINSGLQTLEGQYYVSAAYTNNIVVDSIVNFNACGNVQQPKIHVKNLGNNTISALNISYKYNNNATQTFQWNGQLSWLQTTIIPLPLVSLSTGSQVLEVSITIPNVIDEDNSDNTLQRNFTINNTNTNVIINLQTDSWPEEISYHIIDENDNTIFSVNTFQITGSSFENTLLTESLCLPDGCYKAIIEDSFGDGLGGGNGSSPGYFEIVTDTTQLGIINGNFGDADTILFCVPNFVNTSTIVEEKEVHIFPNPTHGVLNFRTSETPKEIIIYNSLGQTLQHIQPQTNTIHLENYQKGLYFIRFVYDSQSIIKRVVLK